MGLRLIDKNERLTFHGDGFKVYYRRIPNATRGRIVERHTKRGGNVDANAAGIEFLEYSILGWEGFYTQNGDGEKVEVPYGLEHVAAIPDDEQNRLMDLIGINADREEVEGKNSPTTSASKKTTSTSRADSVETKR